jgi:hypothetical protein
LEHGTENKRTTEEEKGKNETIGGFAFPVFPSFLFRVLAWGEKMTMMMMKEKRKHTAHVPVSPELLVRERHTKRPPAATGIR